MKDVSVSILLRQFFADEGIKFQQDTNDSQQTFVTSGFRWGTKAAQAKAELELNRIAVWVKIRLSEKGQTSNIMALPYSVAEVEAFIDQQAAGLRQARQKPPLTETDVAGLLEWRPNAPLCVMIRRSDAADAARGLLDSALWEKDDDFVSALVDDITYCGGIHPVPVYVRLQDDVIVGIYDSAREGAIMYGMHPADLAA